MKKPMILLLGGLKPGNGHNFINHNIGVKMKKFILITLIFLFNYLPANAIRTQQDLLLLYDFSETTGVTIGDKSNVNPKLDLTIPDPSKVTWLNPGLNVSAATVIMATALRSKLDPDVFFTKGITIETWIKPLNNTQSGPARIISFSQDSGNRNFTFGQSADAWDQRLRTSDNPGNGSSPSTSTPAASIAATPTLQHVVYTRDKDGNAKMFIDKVQVSTATISGDGSNWDTSYAFGLFNELNYPVDTRTWLGEIYLVAIYGRNLTFTEITNNYDAGAIGAVPIPLPDAGAYGKIQSGDENHVNQVNYIVPYEIRGNYLLTFEVWDMDVADEIKVLVNNKEVHTLPIIGNEIWSETQTVKIEDIRLCDDNLTNTITFNNTANPPGTNWWGVRNVKLEKDPVNSDLTLYHHSTDQDITIGWDASVSENYPDIFYDFFLWNQGEEKKYLIGHTQSLEVTIKLPRTGLYAFYGRACNKVHTEEDRHCSVWGHSALEELDGTPNGEVEDPNNPGQYIKGAWMIYGHIAAPTGGGIE